MTYSRPETSLEANSKDKEKYDLRARAVQLTATDDKVNNSPPQSNTSRGDVSLETVDTNLNEIDRGVTRAWSKAMSTGYDAITHEPRGQRMSPLDPAMSSGRRIHLLDSITGTIMMIESGKAIVHFKKGDRTIKRSISLDQLKQVGASKIRPGDAVAFISYRVASGNDVLTRLEYLGDATVKIDPDRLEKLDALYRKALNRKQ
ncbi:MAG: hypothetical protein CO189_07730 [candidate division Zixibacteria bacterium CG_4_9_14_3_um_filter_46_8]|nr:MAG: hypothetical protein CO189_07730 [candidate division Zixibacteria bacterium CG_4_9_14_3_um_filter_46_8]